MNTFFISSNVKNGLLEFDFGNKFNCQIGLVSITLPKVEIEDGTLVTITCDQVDATSLNPSRIIRHFYQGNKFAYFNHRFPEVLFHTIDTTDRKLTIRLLDMTGQPLKFKTDNPRVLLTFVLKCDTNKKWL